MREHAAAWTAPKDGWIRATRIALGMSLDDLAQRLGITRGAMTRLEQSEQRGRIRLDTLRRVAAALDAEVAYVVLPRAPLQQMVEAERLRVASELTASVRGHMALEGQDSESPVLDEWRRVRALASVDDRDLWKRGR